jgi:hypothetical protein
MTVSQARQRKLDLRAKELEIRQGTLDRKKKNDADAQARRDAAAKKKEGDAATDAISRRKKKKADIEAKKLEKIKGIAAKRKAGVDKSLARAKQVSKTGRDSETIQGAGETADSDATAQTKMMKGATKAGIAAARTGFNLAKAGAKALGSAPSRMKAGSLQRKADRKQKKIDDRNEKLVAAQDKKVQDRLNRRRMNKVKSTVGKMNPFRGKSDSSKPVNTSDQKLSAQEYNKRYEGGKSKAADSGASKTDTPTRSAAKVAEKPRALNPAKPTRKSAAGDPLARASSNKPVRPARRALPPAGGVNKPTTQKAKPSAAGKMSDAERARKDPKFRRELIAKRSKGMNEEFYQYLMEIERMEKKTDKVIDIMKGKNKIEISPKISEEVTGGILVQDAEDYKPLEIETVDVIKAEPLQEYSALVRQGIKVGGKKGGRAVQAGEKAAIAKGQKMKADAAKGSAEAGKNEKIGAAVGGTLGSAAGFLIPDGPAMVAGEIAGGIAGSKIGGAIGKKFDKKPVKEEASDAMKDRRMERGGVGGNQRYDKAPATPNTFGKKKPKKGGPSAMDIVRADIEKKYGKGAIMDTKKTKKESFSDWRGDLNIQEFIKFTDAAERRAEWRKNHPTKGDFTKWKPGVNVPGVSKDLKVEPMKAGSHLNPVTYKDKPVTTDMVKDYAGKKISQAGDAVKSAGKAVVDYATKNPGKAAAIGAGVVGAGLLAKKVLGGDKKKEQQEHYDWRSELNYVEEGEGKKDACYHKVKASAKVWPSAYASGRLVQCRKKGAANYGNSKKD